MANRLQDALEHLSERLQDHAAVSITYRRSSSSVALSATQGSSLLRIDEIGRGSRVIRTDADFIFPLAGLVIDGSATEPAARGDKIDVTDDEGVTRRYIVVSPGGEEPHYRLDRGRVMCRVHTKYSGTV